jgi:hypothetical protein
LSCTKDNPSKIISLRSNEDLGKNIFVGKEQIATFALFFLMFNQKNYLQ